MRMLGHAQASGPYGIPVYFCHSEKEWRKIHKSWGGEPNEFPPHEGCVTSFKQDNGALLLIVSFRFAKCRSRIEKAGIVSHEATHVWQFFKQAIREEQPGWEVEACAIQWITQWLLESLEAKGMWK